MSDKKLDGPKFSADTTREVLLDYMSVPANVCALGLSSWISTTNALVGPSATVTLLTNSITSLIQGLVPDDEGTQEEMVEVVVEQLYSILGIVPPGGIEFELDPRPVRDPEDSGNSGGGLIN